MEEIKKRLLTMMLNNEGKDFDVTFQPNKENAVGFSFTSYIKLAKIHFKTEQIAASEPLTGKYFSLPMNGIQEIFDESLDEFDIAFTVKYSNGYQVFIQIF